jgi:hypothetical protein
MQNLRGKDKVQRGLGDVEGKKERELGEGKRGGECYQSALYSCMNTPLPA